MTQAKTSPARALRDRVEAMHQAGDRITVISDADTYADRVLVAVRLPAAAFVMTIAREEYDGLAILRLLGVRDEPVKPPPNQIPPNTTKTQPRKRPA